MRSFLRHLGRFFRGLFGHLGRFFRSLYRGAVSSGRRMWDTGGTNLAATLAFYAMMSIFPMLILVIALISWIAKFPASVEKFLNTLEEFAPQYVVDTVRTPLEKLVESGTGAGTVFGVGIILVIWSASGYVGAFGWSANQVGGVSEKRPYLRRLFLRMGVAVLVAIVMLLALVAIMLTENASGWIGDQIAGLGATVNVWSALRWPLFFVVAFCTVLILFSTGPYMKRMSFRDTALGAFLGVALWMLASWGFGIYLEYVGQYSMIYGSLAAIVVFLMWLWLFNLALLYGVSVNAEVRSWRRRRAALAAMPTAPPAVEAAPAALPASEAVPAETAAPEVQPAPAVEAASEAQGQEPKAPPAPAADEPTADEPTADEPTADEPVSGE